MVTEYGMSERLGARKFGTGDGEVFLGRDMSHTRDYSEEIASTIDDEVRRLIESAHDEAWEILVQYREVLDDLVLQLMDKETLSRDEVLRIFAPIKTRPSRGSYTGYGKRLPSDRPPVLTPKELAADAPPRDVQGPALGPATAGPAIGGELATAAPTADACPVRRRDDGRARRDRLSEPIDPPRIERAVREILLAIGEDPDRDGLTDTPARVARAYAEQFSGLHAAARGRARHGVRRRPRRDDPGPRHRGLQHLRAPPGPVLRHARTSATSRTRRARSPACPSWPGWSTSTPGGPRSRSA